MENHFLSIIITGFNFLFSFFINIFIFVKMLRVECYRIRNFIICPSSVSLFSQRSRFPLKQNRARKSEKINCSSTVLCAGDALTDW